MRRSDRKCVLLHTTRDPNKGGVGVLGGVGECLRDDVVRHYLDLLGEPVRDAQVRSEVCPPPHHQRPKQGWRWRAWRRWRVPPRRCSTPLPRSARGAGARCAGQIGSVSSSTPPETQTRVALACLEALASASETM